jgi:CcmD family protein
MSGTAYVLSAVLVIWLGVFFYLISVERKLNRVARNQGFRDRPEAR